MKQFILGILLCVSTLGIAQNTSDKRTISVYGVAEKTTQTITYKTDITNARFIAYLEIKTT